MKLYLGIVLLLLTAFAKGDDEKAKIILVKRILNDIITERNDLAIEYNLYNIGDGVATDVELADSSFHESDFELISGMTSVKWSRINAGSNVTHAIVVQPLRAGDFNFTSAVVQYVSEKGVDVTFGYSNEIGEQEILSLKEYNRLHASHMMEWGLFALWCMPSIDVPLLLYYLSKRKYSKKVKKN
ncbi:translocon-associated protein subunit beta-like [Clavelina lepadiformis]|uniref:translocon-associated protein subunit beta-like n=1 Tax=Clavelina lepadiformis TaxID=159417 RepID=UPI004042C1A0